MRHGLYVMAFAFALSAPAWAQDAALELAQARQAVDKATQADADQYAPDLIGLARQGLEQAQRAAGDRRERKNAPAMALRAAADADLARVRSEEATVSAQQPRRNEVNQLQRQLSTGRTAGEADDRRNPGRAAGAADPGRGRRQPDGGAAEPAPDGHPGQPGYR